jgi:dethiobiotin synthetase
MQGLFVTGTDTSVGKTHVCGRLLDYCLRNRISAMYQKWVSTGAGALPEDLYNCLDAADLKADQTLVDLQTPYRFIRPASPHLAAETEQTSIEPKRIVTAFQQLQKQSELLIVEGVGGILVPLRRDLLLVDLVQQLCLPVVIVARSGLGTLNHTLLTIEALRHRHISILGVVFSDAAAGEDAALVEDNMRIVAEVGRVRVLGRLVRLPEKVDTEQARAGFAPVGEAILDALGKAKDK